jgi:hypothetical protein
MDIRSTFGAGAISSILHPHTALVTLAIEAWETTLQHNYLD